MRGILLMCFGDKAYGKYAFNMAHSIRYYSELPIHLITEKETVAGLDTSIFTSIDFIEFERENGRIDAGLAKIKLFDRSPFTEALYLDVDGIVLKDPEPLFELKSPYAQLMGSGLRGENISYSLWASNDTVWNKYGLKEVAILPTVQTSIVVFNKQNKEFFDRLKENYSNRLKSDEYLEMWGKSKQHPDELYYGVTMAQMGIVPDKLEPVFFPNRIEPVSNILNNYYVLSMFGAGLVKPYAIHLYDKVMQKVFRSKGMNHIYKAHNLYKKKFIGIK